METKEYIDKVIFRIVKSGKFKGKVMAFFPEQYVYIGNRIACYEHIGQHGEAGLSYYYEMTKPAKPEEYSDLKSELESIGYLLKIVKKIPRG